MEQPVSPLAQDAVSVDIVLNKSYAIPAAPVVSVLLSLHEPGCFFL